MELTGLERDVLAWIGQHVADAAVRRQLALAVPLKREHTGVGTFTALCVPDAGTPRTTLRVSPIDPDIVSPALTHGGGCVLYFEDGMVALLELYAYAGDFPESVREWTLIPRAD